MLYSTGKKRFSVVPTVLRTMLFCQPLTDLIPFDARRTPGHQVLLLHVLPA